MALRSGLAAQLGFAAETTWGTYATPDHFYEFDDATPKLNLDYIESPGLRASNRVLRSDRTIANKKGATVDVTIPPLTKNMGLLFKHALGTVAITAVSGLTNSKRHRCTLGDPYGLGLTIQVGVPDTGGTVRPLSYLGGKTVSWELSNAVDGLLIWKASYDCSDETQAQTLATASYPSGTVEVFHFIGGVVNFAGGAVVVKDISIKGTTGQVLDRYGIRSSSLKREPIAGDMYLIEGEATMEFESLTDYNRFVQDTRVQVDATWSSDTAIEATQKSQVTVTLPKCQFRGTSPAVTDAGLTELKLPFKALYDGTNEPITLDYITLDTAS